MAQKESHSDRTQSSPLNLIPPEFAAFGTKGLEGLVQAQSEFFEKIQKVNQDWFDRIQLEATVASEFATKLTAARSVPETAAICQEWARRRLEMAAEDGKRLLGNGQQFMEMGARLLSNNGRRGST
jgi:Phasin protein